jgi:hypothetical protein
LNKSRLSSSGQIALIYLIKSVNLCCRPCYDYERYKDSDFDISFYVEDDFTDADIENFRSAFNIDPKRTVERINGAIKAVCKACDNRAMNSNYLLIVKERKYFDLIRF